MMQRERIRARPDAPADLSEMGAALRDYRPTRDFYQGIVREVNGSSALLFGSAAMLERVSVATDLFVDITHVRCHAIC